MGQVQGHEEPKLLGRAAVRVSAFPGSLSPHTKGLQSSPLGLFSKLPDRRQGEQFRGRSVFGPIAAWWERVLNNCVIHQVPFV